MMEVVRLVDLKEMGEWGNQRCIAVEMIMARVNLKVYVWGEGIFGIWKIVVVVSRVSHVSNISIQINSNLDIGGNRRAIESNWRVNVHRESLGGHW